MNSAGAASTAPTASQDRPLLAIAVGGLLAGIGDIAQAIVVFGMYGATPMRIVQSIPRGIYGPRVFQMGWTSFWLGLVLHFLIATTAAAVYYATSRRMRALVDKPVLFGLMYGEAVFCFMYFVVMPLSAIGWPKFSTPTYITGPIGHPLLVGLPIAFAVRRFSKVKP